MQSRMHNLGALLLLVAACSRSSDEHAPAAARAEPASMAPEAYDRWRRPDVLVAALGLKPGDQVADVGAGRGYLTFRLARAVGPSGRVVATDMDAEALSAMKTAQAPDLAPIEARHVQPDEPGLEAGAYDLILLAQVDHYLPDRPGYLRKLTAALAPGGRIAVSNRIQHRAGLEAAAARAGLTIAQAPVPMDGELPAQFLVFLQPEVSP